MFLDLPGAGSTLFNIPIRANPLISSSTFRDPYLNLSQDPSTFPDLLGAGSTFVDPPQSYLFDSLDFSFDLQRTFFQPYRMCPDLLRRL
jgi:hypothetical protein